MTLRHEIIEAFSDCEELTFRELCFKLNRWSEDEADELLVAVNLYCDPVGEVSVIGSTLLRLGLNVRDATPQQVLSDEQVERAELIATAKEWLGE